MERLDFDRVVRHLEAYERAHPVQYKVRLFVLSLLGYVYVFFALLVVLAICAVYFLLFLVLGIPAAFFILRSLWVRWSPPTGIWLSREQAPVLFSDLDDIRRQLKCPRFHVVLLTDDYNAATVSIPRLGIFGWQKNYLLLGLPYLMATSPEQFRTVLGHEFAHIFGAHSRLARWITRTTAVWERLHDDMQVRRRPGSFMFRRFLSWYLPYFNAYSFVLRRANEFAADGFAAEVTSTQVCAHELVTVTLRGAYLGDVFWPRIWEKARDLPAPDVSPYEEMLQELRSPLPAERVDVWLREATNTKTNTADTHPSLSDRLAALGQKAVVPPVHNALAAEHYLGAGLGEFIKKLSAQWRESVSNPWKERFDQVQQARTRRNTLAEKKQAGPLTLDESWEYATLVEDLQSKEEALSLYRGCLELDPNHSHALYAVGRILLLQRDDGGAEWVEKAMDRNADYVFVGADSLYGYFMTRGHERRAQEYYKRAVIQKERIEKANAERAQISNKDTFLPHDLNAQELGQ